MAKRGMIKEMDLDAGALKTDQGEPIQVQLGILFELQNSDPDLDPYLLYNSSISGLAPQYHQGRKLLSK